MIREQQPAISRFSIGMIGLGTLSAFYRDFSYDWQPVPAFHPGRDVLAVACGLFMLHRLGLSSALGYQAHGRGVHQLSEVELFTPTDRSYIAIFVHPLDSVSGMELFAQ
jgi:hypothetical protein